MENWKVILDFLAKVIGLAAAIIGIRNSIQISKNQKDVKENKETTKKVEKDIADLSKEVKNEFITSQSNVAVFNRSDKPVIVNKNINVVIISPNLGDVCGKAFSWSINELTNWRNNPHFEGADANGYYMEIKIVGLRGVPILEIRPVRADYNRWWDQPLNNDASDISRQLFVFNVYIHPDNKGFHLFRLWDRVTSEKDFPICTWLFEQ